MKRALSLVAAAALFASCTSSGRQAPPPVQPKPVTAKDLVDHAGDSVETAVAVPADAPKDGFDFENEWIYDRIGRFRREAGGTGQLNGRRYDVIDVITPKGDKHKFFFDITEAWNNWKPPQP
jgi:hypothetical protein